MSCPPLIGLSHGSIWIYRLEMKHDQNPNPIAAVAFILLATGLIAVINLLVKALGQGSFGAPLHPFQVSHGRFLFAFLTLGTAVLTLRPRFTRPNFKLHILRTSCGWLGVTLMFAAITYIPLSDATAISFLNPVFAMLLAIPLLGERVGPVRWAAALIALLGAVILLRPGMGSFQPAALLALVAAVVLGFELTVIKRLTGTEGALQILFVNNALGLVISTIAVVFVWVPPTFPQWMALGAVGALMAATQACYVQALRRAEASFVAPFTYTTLANVVILDFAVFGAIPDWISILGASTIVAGAALLIWREGQIAHRAHRRPAQSRK